MKFFTIPVHISIDAQATVSADSVEAAMTKAENTDIKKMDWLSEEIEALSPDAL